MRVLVTGCAGFIGSNLCERLVHDGHDILGIDNFDPMYDVKIKKDNLKGLLPSDSFSFRKADIRNFNAMKKIMGWKPERVVHLAAKAGIRPSINDPSGYLKANVLGTVNVLESMKSTGAPLVFASSSSVYGNANAPFSESDGSIFPLSPYAASKRGAEIYCSTYNQMYGMPITCLRLFTVYGPRQRPDLAIHKFSKKISLGEKIQIFGKDTSRDYTYISDTVQGIVSALEKPMDFEIINLGRSNPVNIMDLVDLIEKGLGKKANLELIDTQMGEVATTYANIGKARKLLGYTPKVPIATGMGLFLDWFKEKNRLGK